MPAARLIAQAQKRPLRQAGVRASAAIARGMRMVCDTPAISDPTCRVWPKLEELESAHSTSRGAGPQGDRLF